MCTLKDFIYIFKMCMSFALPACMLVSPMNAWCRWRTEEGPGSLGTGVTGVMQAQGIKSRSSTRKIRALTTEPSL